MKTFATIKDAFDWWIKNKYPELPAGVKKGKPVQAWKDYTYNRGVSEKRMKLLLPRRRFDLVLNNTKLSSCGSKKE